MFKWAVGNLDEANRKKRMKAANEMMAAAESAIDTARETAKKNRVPVRDDHVTRAE